MYALVTAFESGIAKDSGGISRPLSLGPQRLVRRRSRGRLVVMVVMTMVMLVSAHFLQLSRGAVGRILGRLGGSRRRRRRVLGCGCRAASSVGAALSLFSRRIGCLSGAGRSISRALRLRRSGRGRLGSTCGRISAALSMFRGCLSGLHGIRRRTSTKSHCAGHKGCQRNPACQSKHRESSTY